MVNSKSGIGIGIDYLNKMEVELELRKFELELEMRTPHQYADTQAHIYAHRSWDPKWAFNQLNGLHSVGSAYNTVRPPPSVPVIYIEILLFRN